MVLCLGDSLESDGESESDNGEGEGHDRSSEYLAAVLWEYGRRWQQGMDNLMKSTEWSAAEKQTLQAVLHDDKQLYEDVLFIAIKYREKPSQAFARIGSSRKMVEFICNNIERGMEREETRGRYQVDGLEFRAIVVKLLKKYWDHKDPKQLQQHEEVQSTFRWIELNEMQSVDQRAAQGRISRDLDDAMSLLTNVYETWCDWAPHGYQETERHVASIREQAETVKLGL
jgi:hypothetical protein